MFGIELIPPEIAKTNEALQELTRVVALRGGQIADAQKENTGAIQELTRIMWVRLGEIVDVLKVIAVELHTDDRRPPPNPKGFIRFRLLGETAMSKLIYEVDLPTLPPGDPANADVDHGLLRTQYDGVEQEPIKTKPDQTVLTGITIDQGVAVTGDFAFVDDADNESKDPIELVPFTTSDTVPPPDPVGGLGFRQVGEETAEAKGKTKK